MAGGQVPEPEPAAGGRRRRLDRWSCGRRRGPAAALPRPLRGPVRAPGAGPGPARPVHGAATPPGGSRAAARSRWPGAPLRGDRAADRLLAPRRAELLPFPELRFGWGLDNHWAALAARARLAAGRGGRPARAPRVAAGGRQLHPRGGDRGGAGVPGRPALRAHRPGAAHAGRPSGRLPAAEVRVLVVPKWYPWPELPVFGVFCREHAAALATRHDVVVLASLFTPDPPDFRVFQLDRRGRGRPARAAGALPPAPAAAARAGVPAGSACSPRCAACAARAGAPTWCTRTCTRPPCPRWLLGRLSGAPVVVTEHYTGFGRGLITGCERRLARVRLRARRPGGPGQPRAGGHAARDRAPRRSIEVVPNTVDTGAFAPPAASRPARRRAAAQRGGAGREEGPRPPARGAGRGSPGATLDDRRRRRAARASSSAGRASWAGRPRDLRWRAAQARGGAADARGGPVRAAQPGREPAGGADRGDGQRAARRWPPAWAGCPRCSATSDGVLVEPGDPEALAAAIRAAARRASSTPRRWPRAPRSATATRPSRERWSEIYEELRQQPGQQLARPRAARPPRRE